MAQENYSMVDVLIDQGFSPDERILDHNDPVPFNNHPKGIAFELPLGALVMQSSLRNGVFIYDNMPDENFPSYVSLLPFGNVIEKTLMDYLSEHFTELVCKEVYHYL